MNRSPIRGAFRIRLALCASVLLAPAISGHGGGHKPPPPKPPQELPPPGAPGPYSGPGDSRGGPTTAPAGPSSPGPAAPGPSGGPPQASGPAAPTTAAPGGGTDEADWSVWWELNQHAFLELRDAIWNAPVRTGQDEFFDAQTLSGAPPDPRPSDEELAQRVAPALRRALERERQPEVLTGCLTALAKIGAATPGGDPATAEVIASFLDHPHQQIRETAALSLGLLGGAASLRELAALLAGDERGRKLRGGAEVDARTRAFAAYGIGIFAQRASEIDLRRYAVHQLVNALRAERSAPDLDVAILEALALIELPSKPLGPDEDAPELPAAASREALCNRLLAVLADPALDERTRAHATRGIARSIAPGGGAGDAAAHAALLELAARGKALDRELLYGAIAALGLIEVVPEPATEVAERELLLQIAAQGDVLARAFAWISLAQVSSRAGSSGEAALRAREALLRVLVKGKSRERPWAALALGVQGWRLAKLRRPVSADVELALRASFVDCGSPSDAAAYAIALGLCGALDSAPVVRERLDSTHEDRARGYLALSLGLMRDQASVELLQDLLPRAVYRPDLIRPLAIALALLGDPTLVPELAERMEATDSSAVRAVYAWTLAHVGDARAIDPLIALLDDQEAPDLSRGIAALGLGITCERTLLPWNTELSRNANYPAAPPSLYSSEGGGVLNIR